MKTDAIAKAMIEGVSLNSHTFFGQVITLRDGLIQVLLDSGKSIMAKQAFSCPIQVQNCDYVELSHSDSTGHFVLHILERDVPSPAVIKHPLGVEFESPSISMKSNALKLEPQNLTVNSVKTEHNAQTLKITADHAQLQARTVESSADSMIQRVKDSFKLIERIEHIKAKDVLHSIKNAFIQRAKQIDVTAEGDVKINGDRIHMG